MKTKTMLLALFAAVIISACSCKKEPVEPPFDPQAFANYGNVFKTDFIPMYELDSLSRLDSAIHCPKPKEPVKEAK